MENEILETPYADTGDKEGSEEIVQTVMPRKKIKKNGRSIREKTDQEYTGIWEAFKLKAFPEFKEMFGFGHEEILEIGYEKFIDAMDWVSTEEVLSFKTDLYHLIVCPECKDDFGIYEDGVGLCPKCIKLFDMKRFNALHEVLLEKDMADESENPSSDASDLYLSFLMIPEFRDNYRLLMDNKSIFLRAVETEFESKAPTLALFTRLIESFHNESKDKTYSKFKEYVLMDVIPKISHPDQLIVLTGFMSEISSSFDFKQEDWPKDFINFLINKYTPS